MTPSRQQAAEAPEGDVRFSYFLLQRTTGPRGAFRHFTLEELGSGTKWTFGSGSALLRFLESDPEGVGDERWAPPGIDTNERVSSLPDPR